MYVKFSPFQDFSSRAAQKTPFDPATLR